MTDAGMTGDLQLHHRHAEGRADPALYLRAFPQHFEPALGPAMLSGIAVETDNKTGLAVKVAAVRVGGRLSQSVPKLS